MKYIALLLILVIVYPADLLSQERSRIEFGDISLKDFELPRSSVIDSNTNGVILYDIGSSKFQGNKNRWYSCVYKRHTRIKILNNKAYELATFRFFLYGKGDNKDQIDELKATVYNIENGKIVTSSASKADLLEEKLSPYKHENKLTLPSVREGSIIEYTYTITSHYYSFIRPWLFQNLEYPCLYSEYDVVFPNMLSFAKVRYGTKSFFINKETTVKQNSYTMNSAQVYSDDATQLWVMKDVPAFKIEKFINAPADYLERIEFFLRSLSDGLDTHDKNTSWDKANKNLLESDDFGGAIDAYNVAYLANAVERLTGDDKSLMESAKHLFFYVRDNFTCIPNNDIFLEDNLYRINKKKKGSVAEINLLLTGLLRQKGIPADPVILSTKSYGINSPDYPLLHKMNYVICMLRLYGDTIYLDATRPELGFGKLSQDCYNGHARIINKNGASIYFNPDDIKELKTTRVFILNDGKGKLGGSVETEFGFFGTEALRKQVRELGTRKYLDNIKLSYEDVEIQPFNTRLDSLDNPEFPVTIHYEFSRPANGDILYFNPVVTTEYKENPFKSEQRKHPIALPYPIDDLYTLNMEIPEGYVADELPKSVKVSFNVDEGFFEYIAQKSESSIQLRSRIKLKAAVFLAEDYNSLRDFFAFIVKKQSEQIVFKKKN